MADPSHLGLPTPSKSQRSKDEAIINRGREHKGLTGSFSSNLGQRTSSAQTCREPKAKAGANGFVKALVAKLESSDDISTMSSMSNVSAGSTSPKSKQPVSPVSSPSPDSSYQKPPNVPQAAPGVEGYSLTFLKYQQYFARDKPLYRCLDEQETSSDSSKTRVDFQISGGQTPLPEELQKILRGSPEKPSQEAQPQLKRAEATTPKKADHNGTGGIQANTEDKQPQDSNTNKRDPEEVKAFWDHVRNYLAPSDSESDEPEAPSKKRGDKKDRRNNREAASSLSPHRKANSAPNVDVRGYFTPPGRVRFLSVEEKMMEIDEFFGTEDNDDETSVRR
ncbi:unnamed protein product [Clonostachys byssicola]|uniref:Uncharacterized protein n=1 Tax=Clonostachys byssicola TaxID=160290 RepID=A0A9N9UU61_9HYPO|nr:unnamed protein product [Clonostachys byssicola]